jgi:hypothetical protein
VKGRNTHTLLVPLEVAGPMTVQLALSNGPSRVDISRPFHLKKEIDPVFETLCSLEYRNIDKVQKPSNSAFNTRSSEPFGMSFPSRIYFMHSLQRLPKISKFRNSLL